MKPSHDRSFAHRPHIDGLRAVAVVPVILFHAGFKLFSGGFVGVDIFFVISGYLITSIVMNELQAGTFSIRTFYERRARRILPPLLVVLMLSIPAAWCWLDAVDFRSFSKSLIAVSTFSSNVLFWRETGYFDTTAELKPLLHTWTLAVEEQYYVVLPLLMMLSWKLKQRGLSLLFAGIVIASLACAEMGAQTDSMAAFYLLPTRAWELMTGSFIAVCFAQHASIRGPVVQAGCWRNQLLSLAGLLLIVFAFFSYDESTIYPGVHALAPTLGAALIILNANGQTLVGRLLGSRVFTAIGLISYSAYLWHQPVFAFVRNVSIVEPTPATMLAFTAFSLLLAYLSWRYVEQPFRDRTKVSTARFLKVTMFASVGVIATGVSGYFSDGFSSRFADDPLMAGSFTEPTLRRVCDQGYDGKGWDIKFCMFGDSERALNPDAAVFGDSHAEALLPAFDQAGKKVGQAIVEVGLGGCPPLIGVDVLDSPYDPGVCSALAARELQYVKQHGIKKVFLVSRWSLYTDTDLNKERKTDAFLVSAGHHERTQANSRAVFQQAVHDTIQAYREAGASVFIVAQVPQQLVTPKNIYYRLSRDGSLTPAQRMNLIKEVSVPLERNAQIQRFSREVFQKEATSPHRNLVVLDREFCDAQICLLGDTQSYYKDYNHLNAYGAARVSGLIGDLLLRRI